MYTKVQFGKDLKEKVLNKTDLLSIAEWASSIQFEGNREDDENFDTVLHYLDVMSFGEQHEFSYDALNKIADDLILGNEIDMLSSKYK